jgi:sugar transferase (PEP-CTERM system associated)
MIRLFRHYVPRSLLLLAVIEGLIFSGAVYLGKMLTLISYDYELTDATLPEAIGIYFQDPLTFDDIWLQAAVLTAIMIGTITSVGLYERNFWDGRGDMILRVGVSFVIGFFTLSLLYYVFPDWRLARREFSMSFSIAFLGLIITRYIFLKVINQSELRRRVLVLGTGYKARRVESLALIENPSFALVGFILLKEEGIHVSSPGRILPIETNLYDLCEEKQVDEIVVALDERRGGELPMKDILDCKISGVEVSEFLLFMERETGQIDLDDLRPSSMIYSDGFHQAVLKVSSKRLFDLLISLIILILTSPLILLTALAVWLESGGRDPVFYIQERVGKNEKTFKVIKFRSMHVDAEKGGKAQWVRKNDPRITRVGAFIRKVRLDELPQVFNVLFGHMSFVGPRPERPQIVKELEKVIPYYSLRHRVNPGITGWAQLCFHFPNPDNMVEDAREKLQYDLYYIKNYSLFLDMMVLLQTAHVVLWAKGN